MSGPLGGQEREYLGGGKEEGGGGSDGLGVGVRPGIERGPRRRGSVEGSKLVELSGVEWGRRVTPLEGRRAGSMARETK